MKIKKIYLIAGIVAILLFILPSSEVNLRNIFLVLDDSDFIFSNTLPLLTFILSAICFIGIGVGKFAAGFFSKISLILFFVFLVFKIVPFGREFLIGMTQIAGYPLLIVVLIISLIHSYNLRGRGEVSIS